MSTRSWKKRIFCDLKDKTTRNEVVHRMRKKVVFVDKIQDADIILVEEGPTKKSLFGQKVYVLDKSNFTISKYNEEIVGEYSMPKRKNEIDENKEDKEGKSLKKQKGKDEESLLHKLSFTQGVNQKLFEALEGKNIDMISKSNRDLRYNLIPHQIEILNSKVEDLFQLMKYNPILSKVKTIRITGEVQRRYNQEGWNFNFKEEQFPSLQKLELSQQYFRAGVIRIDSKKFTTLESNAYIVVKILTLPQTLERLWTPKLAIGISQLRSILWNSLHLRELSVELSIKTSTYTIDLTKHTQLMSLVLCLTSDSIRSAKVKLASLENMKLLSLIHTSCTVEKTADQSSIRWLHLRDVDSLDFLGNTKFKELNLLKLDESYKNDERAIRIFQEAVDRRQDQIPEFKSMNGNILTAHGEILYCCSCSGITWLHIVSQNPAVYVYNLPDIIEAHVSNVEYGNNIILLPYSGSVNKLVLEHSERVQEEDEEKIHTHYRQILKGVHSIHNLDIQIQSFGAWETKLMNRIAEKSIKSLRLRVKHSEKKSIFRLKDFPQLEELFILFQSETHENERISLEFENVGNIKTIELRGFLGEYSFGKLIGVSEMPNVYKLSNL